MAEARIRAVITAEDRATKVIQGFGSHVESLGAKATMLSKRLAIVATATATAGLAIGVKTSAQLESAEQGFKALLGSAEEAGAVMNRIKEEAKATPFELTGLIQGAQALTAVTKDGDKAIDTLLDVGKAIAVSGKGQAEMDRVILNLQQISSTGKVTAMDLRQFRSAIPIFDDITASIGMTGEEIAQSENATELLFQAFNKAGQEGGITAEGFTAQAGTFNQVMSNLKDSIAIATSEIINQTGAFDLLKDLISDLGSFFDDNKDLIINAVKTIGNIISSVFSAVSQAINFLKPDFMALFFVIKDNLIPALMNLWNSVLKPLVPVLGVILVASIKILTNALNVIIRVVTFAMNVFRGLITAIVGGAGKVKDAGASIINIFRDIKNKVVNFIQAIIDKIAFIPRKVGEAVDSIKSLSNNLPHSSALSSVAEQVRVGNNALGGSISSGEPSIVGEHGAELFVPNQSGTIIPNQDMGGGGKVSLNVNIGMFAGTPSERRKIAQTLFDDLKDIASKQGKSVMEMM